MDFEFLCTHPEIENEKLIENAVVIHDLYYVIQQWRTCYRERTEDS